MEQIITNAALILSSAGVVKLIDWWIEKRRRKLDKKEEKAVTQEQLEELENKISGKLDLLSAAQMVSMRDRISYLGREYIATGSVKADDLDIIIQMHKAYHDLGGNGYLDTLMSQVKKLQIRQ